MGGDIGLFLLLGASSNEYFWGHLPTQRRTRRADGLGSDFFRYIGGADLGAFARRLARLDDRMRDHRFFHTSAGCISPLLLIRKTTPSTEYNRLTHIHQGSPYVAGRGQDEFSYIRGSIARNSPAAHCRRGETGQTTEAACLAHRQCRRFRARAGACEGHPSCHRCICRSIFPNDAAS